MTLTGTTLSGLLSRLLILSLAATISHLAFGSPPSPPATDTDGRRHFDVLIRDGWIVDGIGTPRYRADVAVDKDEIVVIGSLPDATANRVIEARDRIVTPGFIDLHTHLLDGRRERGLLSSDVRRRAAQNYVAQGVTTAVANPDGRQDVPLREARQALQANGSGVNVVLMNGHSGMRAAVMQGNVRRAANEDEIRKMEEMLRHDLEREGSFGMSLGIEYEGARDASLQEQLALGRVLARYNGIFIPHLRSQGISPMWYRPSRDRNRPPPTLDDAIDETLAVAETGATIVFTHFKAWGPGYRGESARLIAKLQAARDRGARVYMDVYPYDSSGSDGEFVVLPAWAFGSPQPKSGTRFDYRAALDATLAAATQADAKALASDVLHQLALKGGTGNVRVLSFPNAAYVDKTYAELMQLRGLDEVALAIALQREGDQYSAGGARMRSFSMSEQDLENFFRLDWCAVSTDGWIVLPEEAVGDLKYVGTNRRVFGSYPRRLAHFSASRKIDSLEHAIRASSGLPAHILGLNDRGRIAVGMKADLVVLDMDNLRDNTSYLEPSAYPSGIDYVLVNGTLAVDRGNRTLALAGKVLQPPGRAAAATPGRYRDRSAAAEKLR